MERVVDKENANLVEPKDLLGQIDDGIESGFSWCCIIAFIIRVRIFPKCMQNWFPRLKNQDHILCVFHYVYHMFVRMRYYYCHNCNWVQYKKQKCNKCKNCEHEFHFIGDLYLCKRCAYIKHPSYSEPMGDKVIQHYDEHIWRIR